MTYPQLLRNVRQLHPMAFSRWGDGEWLTIREAFREKGGEKLGKNCDGNVYYPQLGKRLHEIVRTRQPYVMGAQLQPYLTSDREKYDQDWVDADILHRASIQGKLGEFSDILTSLQVVYTGNQSLKALGFIDEFIEIPPTNVWKQYDQVLAHLAGHVSGQTKVFLFSAGMAANVFIHDMWSAHPGNLYLDVGSVFDPYVGRFTRSYHKKLKQLSL